MIKLACSMKQNKSQKIRSICVINIVKLHQINECVVNFLKKGAIDEILKLIFSTVWFERLYLAIELY